MLHHGRSADHAAIVEADLLEADPSSARIHGHSFRPVYCDLIHDARLTMSTQHFESPASVAQLSCTTEIVDSGKSLPHHTMQAVIHPQPSSLISQSGNPRSLALTSFAITHQPTHPIASHDAFIWSYDDHPEGGPWTRYVGLASRPHIVRRIISNSG